MNEPLPLFHCDFACFHEIFEWLSLEDIHTVGQTCQRLKAIATSFVGGFLPAANLVCQNDGIRTTQGGFLNGFCVAIQQVTVKGDDFEPYRYIQAYCKSLKRINFEAAVITEDRAKQIESILNKIETIQLKLCNVNGEFFDCFLKFCKNLKHLIIDGYYSENILIGTNNQWLSRIYPKIENIELDVPRHIPALLINFFKHNSHIQSFATDNKGLLYLQNALKQSEIRLSVLSISFSRWEEISSDILKAMISLLCELREQCIYKRLHCHEKDTSIFSLRPYKLFKELLNTENCDNYDNDSLLIDLVHLSVYKFEVTSVTSQWSYPVIDLEVLAKNLLKLDRLTIYRTRFEHILPFIQHSVNLKTIAIEYFDGDIIDLPALNKERKKLLGARKVTIYVEERVFLATKWASKTTHLGFIELKRIESLSVGLRLY